MVGLSDAQKIAEIAKSFAVSQSSALSLIVVDDIERLIDWVPKSGTFSNAVLQALLVLFRRRPPKVICVDEIYPFLIGIPKGPASLDYGNIVHNYPE